MRHAPPKTDHSLQAHLRQSLAQRGPKPTLKARIASGPKPAQPPKRPRITIRVDKRTPSPRCKATRCLKAYRRWRRWKTMTAMRVLSSRARARKPGESIPWPLRRKHWIGIRVGQRMARVIRDTRAHGSATHLPLCKLLRRCSRLHDLLLRMDKPNRNQSFTGRTVNPRDRERRRGPRQLRDGVAIYAATPLANIRPVLRLDIQDGVSASLRNRFPSMHRNTQRRLEDTNRSRLINMRKSHNHSPVKRFRH